MSTTKKHPRISTGGRVKKEHRISSNARRAPSSGGGVKEYVYEDELEVVHIIHYNGEIFTLNAKLEWAEELLVDLINQQGYYWTEMRRFLNFLSTHIDDESITGYGNITLPENFIHGKDALYRGDFLNCNDMHVVKVYSI